jgi:hypothetical protein
MGVKTLIILVIIQILLILVGFYVIWKKLTPFFDRIFKKNGKILPNMDNINHIKQIQDQINSIKEYMNQKNKK